MRKEEIEKRLKSALSVAEKASSFLLEHEKMRTVVFSKGENDYVTQADKLSEELIYSTLMKEYPEDGWYGEETGEKGEKTRRWIVDPIDGTVDFMWSFPLYTISIAFEDEYGIALGVVIVPRQKEVFYAIRGGGAFLNGERITINDDIDPKKSLALLVPPHRRHSIMDEYMVRMREFYNHFSDMRSIGSAACSLSFVASSRCALYYEESLQLYDIAAGILIVKEAGGRVSIKKEKDYLSVIASASSVHDEAMEIISDKGRFIRF